MVRKTDEPAPIPAQSAKPPRPLLEQKRRDRIQKFEELTSAKLDVHKAVQKVTELERELSLCRFDELWLEDHPDIENILTPDFLARFLEGQRKT